ncbi:hypothetical protein AB1K62_00430 [Parasphingorhabdus sp. JC815]|uniref:hypothetical protein n=1 Tax=Parasphingorhabdus sp. JC815 TaxID=3232140 RepID=UPI00345B46AB
MSTSHSRITSTDILYSAWLVFDDKGGLRLTRGIPQIDRYERRIKLDATLPKSLFREPELKATIKVPPNDQSTMAIDIEAATTALQGALGCDIDLKIHDSEEK